MYPHKDVQQPLISPGGWRVLYEANVKGLRQLPKSPISSHVDHRGRFSLAASGSSWCFFSMHGNGLCKWQCFCSLLLLLEFEVKSEIMENNIDQEAFTAVKKALKLQKNNLVKTQKLFQHAWTITPNHHDILLHYGEYLESCNNFIDADHIYFKATMLRPENSEALLKRERTLKIANQIDLMNFQRIHSKWLKYESLDQEDPRFQQIKKMLHLWYIHHTVAIEGNNMSLDETSTVLESRMPVAGRSILEFNEILGLESAFVYVSQTLAKKKDPVTETDILEVHRRLMGKVDPTSAGSFHKGHVLVDEHNLPPVTDIDYLMAAFILFLDIPEFKELHPIHAAAYAHHKFLYINPFLDGNGKIARLLMNLLFIKHGYPPVIIRKDLKSQYLKVLQIAKEGDIRPFYRFIALAAEYTIDAFLHGYKI